MAPISPQSEKKVREAFTGVVAKDIDRAMGAIRGMTDQEAAEAFMLCMQVCGFVVYDIFRRAPSLSELTPLAEQSINSLGETGALGPEDLEDLKTLLAAAGAGFLGNAPLTTDSSIGLPLERAFYLSVVCGGFLLAGFHRKDQRWWDYLDVIWESFLLR